RLRLYADKPGFEQRALVQESHRAPLNHRLPPGRQWSCSGAAWLAVNHDVNVDLTLRGPGVAMVADRHITHPRPLVLGGSQELRVPLLVCDRLGQLMAMF